MPTVIKQDSFVCIGCRLEYDAARDLAVAEASALLARLAGCSLDEFTLFVTTVGDLRNGAVWKMGLHSGAAPDWWTGMPLCVGVEAPLP